MTIPTVEAVASAMGVLVDQVHQAADGTFTVRLPPDPATPIRVRLVRWEPAPVPLCRQELDGRGSE